MANIKYGRTNGVTTIPITSDPYATLGAAIGTMLGNNYYERGENKATQRAINDFEQVLNSDGTYSVPAELYSDAVNAGVVGNTNGGYNFQRPADESLYTLAPDESNASNGVLSSLGGGGVSSNGADGTGQKNHAVAKWNLMQEKYADNPNPVSDSIKTEKITNVAEKGLSKLQNMENFDKASYRLALNKKLIAEGRNASQRAAAWAAIEPIIDEKQKQYDTQKFGQLAAEYQNLMSTGDEADMKRAAALVPSMLKYDARIGQAIISSNPTPKDYYNLNKQKEMANFNNNLITQRQANRLAGGGGGIGIAGNAGSTRTASNTGGTGRSKEEKSANNKFDYSRYKFFEGVKNAYEEDPDRHGGYTEQQYKDAKAAINQMFAQNAAEFHTPTFEEVYNAAASAIGSGELTLDEAKETIASKYPADVAYAINSELEKLRNNNSVGEFRQKENEMASGNKTPVAGSSDDVTNSRRGFIRELEDNGGILGYLGGVRDRFFG